MAEDVPRVSSSLNVLSGHILRYSIPVSILHKSITGRYRPVRVGDGPITARCRFIASTARDARSPPRTVSSTVENMIMESNIQRYILSAEIALTNFLPFFIP